MFPDPVMNFLHLLANLDAYQACLEYREEESPASGRHSHRGRHSRTVVRFSPEKPQTPTSTPGLRPTSVVSVQEGRLSGGSTELRPKSGKSLTFRLAPGRHTPAHSVSEAEFKIIRRDIQTPVSVTRVENYRDGYASGRSTQLSSIREGARSPTPNAAKDMEHAFIDVTPDMPGLSVWRIQGTTVRCCDVDEYGFFHEGNVYIVLNVVSPNDRTLHYWIGSQATEAEAALGEKKAHHLDLIVANAHLFSREVQNHESTVFRRVFPDGIVYIEGKHKQSVPRAAQYEKRLYLVTGRKYARAACVFPSRVHMQSSNIVILDGFPRIYVWIGKDSGYVIKNKAIRLARKMQLRQRNGTCHVVVIDETETSLSERFKLKFDDCAFPELPTNGLLDQGEGEHTEEHDSAEQRLVMHRVSGDRVLYDMPEAHKRPFKQRYLVTRDSFLLDQGPREAMYMWVGADAMEDEVNNAISRAKSLREHHGYPAESPVCRVREGHEPTEMKQCFCDWRDHLSKGMPLTKIYSAGNVGRALFSRTDRRTVATVKGCWSEDTLGEIRKNTQVWVLSEGELSEWDHVGVFTNARCFLVFHTTLEGAHFQYVLYYWLGTQASRADKDRIIRVLDGREPQHFMTALADWMLVYDGELETESDRKLFCVRDAGDRATRIQQMPLCWDSFNSSASFLLLTEDNPFLWYGRQSGSTEREATKDLLGILCSAKMYSYEVVPEGKETVAFLKHVGGTKAYETEYKTQVLERRPPCLLYCHPNERDFELIDNFQQEDLSEEGVFILDTFDQLFMWCGERVEGKRRKRLLELSEAYIRCDPACRDHSAVSVWAVSQRCEPLAFIKHFRTWNALGYSGRHSYEILRKRVRQENAKIDIDQNLVDTTFLSQPKYPYRVLLQKELPPDIDDTNKHNHLSERQFRDNLKVSRLEFYRFPVWKQRQVLRSARLLYVPPVIQHAEPT
ncbi:AVIL-like protein [Mya arenaria]|uniref:AVIL-like protein n=1 Tax=Mya arenaria TaxID=6604 RepID=A0ABY7DRB0_MYAAR|nr:AVIL-like protein [Mya arenaria]